MAAARKFLSLETVSLIMAFAILAVAGFVTMHTEEYRRKTSGSMRHTLMVESALHRLYGTVRRAESDERGFLITREVHFLDPHEDISGRLERELGAVSRLVADNPEQNARLEQIRPLLKERLGLLMLKLDLMKGGRFDEAIEIVRSGRGKETMDQIDTLISEMISNEERQYRATDETLRRATESLQMAIGALIVIVAGVAVFSIALAQKQMNALRHSSESLKRAYNTLMEESTRREKLEAQLRQSQKLEALGQLTGGIAHDFNNMLGVIVASLNILRRKLRRNEDGGDQLIDSALNGAENAAGLVRRLLAFSRIQPLAPTPIDVNSFVAELASMVRQALGENIALETKLADGVWLTKVDRSELENALLNLAVNARDAMPDGGRLVIETANRPLDAAYAAENVDVTVGDYVLVAVTDTGEGMPPAVIANAFDPFFTTKPVGKGTGLGLSQVHGFIKQSGGHVKIVSEPGRGTTVKLYLPRHGGASTSEKLPAHASGDADEEIDFPLGDPGEIILVVEDDEIARHVTVAGIRELGYSALEAASGAQALETLEKQPEIRLMVTDVIMPEMDGAALSREAQKRWPRLKVLHVSGLMPGAQAGLLDKGVNLLPKPFTLEQIGRRIRTLLDGG